MADDKNHRCVICNSTNSLAIATEPEDYKPHLSFVTVDDGMIGKVICEDCNYIISDSIYELQDDEG